MYSWETNLESIINAFRQQIKNQPDNIENNLKNTVTLFAKLMQISIAEEFSEKRLRESMLFLEKSVVVINSMLPDEILSRLAVNIVPLPPSPRIEIRLINSEYTLSGHLAVIADICPEKEMGECLATIYLVQMSSCYKSGDSSSPKIH